MDVEAIRLTSLQMAIDHTNGGTSWEAIIKVAQRFEHYISTGQDKDAEK